MSRLKPFLQIVIIFIQFFGYQNVAAQCDYFIQLEGQSSKRLGRGGANLELCVNIITTETGTKYRYKLVNGPPSENFQVSWQFTYYTKKGDTVTRQLQLGITGPSASGEVDLPAYKSYARNYKNLEITTAETAGIPSSSIVRDIRIIPLPNDLIFEGESITFNLPELKTGVMTVWTTNGKIIDRENRKLTVRAEKGLQVAVSFRNGIFSSEKMQIVVPKVQRLADYYTYDVTKPLAQLHPDTLPLSIRIQPKLKSDLFVWHWYFQDKRTSKLELGGTGPDFIISPPNLKPLTGLRAELHYNGRVVAIEKFGVDVYEIPGPPSNFTISPRQIFFEGEPARLEVRSTDRTKWSKDLKWIWQIGKQKDTTAVLFYDIPAVSKNAIVSVRSYLNTKVSKEVKLDLKNFVKIRSVLPLYVLGDTSVCVGRAEDLLFKFENTQLGSDNTKWVLYFDGKEYARSKTPEFKISTPTKMGTYQLRIFPDKEPMNVFSFKLNVHAAPQIPDAIVQSSPLGQLCPGSNVTLTTNPSMTNSNTYLDWYIVEKNSALNYLATGLQLEYTLKSKTTFILKSRTDQCVSSIERKLVLSPIIFNYKPDFAIIKKNGKNSRYRSIKVSSPDLPGLRYMWYLNHKLLSSNQGRIINNLRLRKGLNEIKLSVMDECNQEVQSDGFINLPKPKPFGYLAIGATSNRFDMIPNWMFTVGSRSLYIRAKFNPLAQAAIKENMSGFMGVPLEVNDKSQLTNFPPATGMFYTITSGLQASHTGLTVGGMVTLSNPRYNYRFLPISFVFGAGYGTREMYWTTQIESYTDQRKTSHWARNIDQSWKGLEVEGGVFVPITGGLFFQPGFSAIFDPNKRLPYVAVNFSLGIAFKKKN